jgi:CheY-like chemotaxis protein
LRRRRREFESADWKVIEAPDGKTPLKTSVEQKPQLILLDVQMPGESGFTVYADLRQDPATSDISVIMVTGIGEKTGLRFGSHARREYMGEELEGYLEKRVGPEIPRLRQKFDSTF